VFRNDARAAERERRFDSRRRWQESIVFEYHGWATIRETFRAEELREDPAPATLEAVQRLIAPHSEMFNRVADLRIANGDWHLWLAGLHNHRDEGVIDLFRGVAATAPGSYGLLYVFDDELGDGRDDARNSWRCWVMKRGEVSETEDALLSPHVPTVEDALSEN
jgi:hypothetical protein